MITMAVTELTLLTGTVQACRTLGLPRASYYRIIDSTPPAPRPRGGGAQPSALSAVEREQVLDVLHDPRFVDMAVEQVYHSLLDDGKYLCSISTMYRILRERGETGERRRQASHPANVKPELVATRPNQVWSWDITKIKGPGKWEWYHLYVIIDVFSRFNPGWLLAARESDRLAEAMITNALQDQKITPGQLVIHADRGSSMTSKTVAQLLADLEVGKSHSRPHVSNDNPYSEAQFKTMKYRPEFPARFTNIEQARVFIARFFNWYNTVHLHCGIGYHTPYQAHHGLTDTIDEKRATTLFTAWKTHPERFARGQPQPPTMATSAWINKPEQEDAH
jgi:putative transposase